MSIDPVEKRIEEASGVIASGSETDELLDINERAIKASSSEEEFNSLVRDSRAFILKQASAASGRFVTESDDEWSVALLAFNEAVKGYDLSKGKFYPFASVVIKRRIVDLQRKDFRRKNEIPLDTASAEFSDQAEEGQSALYSEFRKSELHAAEKVEEENDRAEEIRNEIEELTALFSDYGFSFMDLTECSPKAGKTKESTKLAINALLSSESMMSYLRTKKVLPMKELCEKSGVSRKIIDRHRRYIIACALILEGEFPMVSDYLLAIKDQALKLKL